MAILLVCGDTQSGGDLAQNLLVKAGLAVAKPSKRENFAPEEISRGILQANGIDDSKPAPISQIRPGQVWNALSTDLMLANLSETDWCWSDTDSVYLLEHWRDFDPQIKFLLVYSSPEAVAEGLYAGEDNLTEDNLQRAMADWENRNTELLRFYHANKDRCMLVNSDTVAEAGEFFIEMSRDQLNVQLQDVSLEDLETRKRTPVFGYVAPSLLTGNDAADLLFKDLESAADIPSPSFLGANAMLGTNARHNFALAVSTKESSQQEQALELLQQFRNLEDQNRQHEDSISELQDHTQTLEAEILALNNKVEEAKSTARDTAEDRQLFREQVVQLQEQLKLTATQLSKIKEQEAEQRTSNEKLVRDNNLLKIRMNTARNKQEQHEAELRVAQASLGKLTSERDELQKKSDEFLSRIKDLENEVAKGGANQEKVAELENSLHKSMRENDLVLMQMQQVQEELDLYFSKYQRAKDHAQASEQKLSEVTRQAGIVQEVDFRHMVDGENWYYAEHDGRWAGPEGRSNLHLNRLHPGEYTLELNVVDAMSPEILAGMKLQLNGKPLKLSWPGKIASGMMPLAKLLRMKTHYPVQVTAPMHVAETDQNIGLTLSFVFPKTISPADHGSDDFRKLAIRVRSVRVLGA